MNSLPPRLLRSGVRGWSAAVVAWLAVCAASPLAGQLPQLKTGIAGVESFVCPEPGASPVVSDEDRRQALQLGSTASQALILGEVERARGLLARATALDPSSPALAYQHGRVLEDLGEPGAAARWYCAALAAGAEGEEAADARERVDRFAEAQRRQIPEGAREAFAEGIAATEERRLDAAARAFERALAAHADFAEAAFNRAVVLERRGEAGAAAEGYRDYLRLRPGAPDAIGVSERIGQLQAVGDSAPGAGSALALGLLLPGGGQFHTGRPLGGVAVLALAGGAAAAAFLVSETDVRCLQAVEPGASCPPAQVVGRTTRHPYRTLGIAGAAAIALGGAIEAFLHARGLGEVEVAGMGGGAALLLGPSVGSGSRAIDVRFVRVTF